MALSLGFLAQDAFTGERPGDDPVLETAKIFAKVKAEADTTTARLEKLEESLDKIHKAVQMLETTDLPEGVKVKIIEKTAAAQRIVSDGLAESRRLKRCFGIVQDGLDLYAEMEEMIRTARGLDLDAGGNLGTSLYSLSHFLEKYAGKVPLLGPALKVYGTAGKELLQALARLNHNLNERRQAHVGLGIPPFSSRRNTVLFEKNKAVFERDTYAPGGPSYAYRPISPEAEQKMILLWDEGGDCWYIVDRRVNAEQVFRDNLLLGRNLKPAVFWKYLRYPNYENLQKQRELGLRIAAYFNGLSNVAPYHDEDIFFAWQAADQHDLPFHKKDLFAAYFTYDDAFRPQVWAQMKRLHDGLCNRKKPDLAGKVRGHARNWGCTEADTWACATPGGPAFWEETFKDWFVTHHYVGAEFDVHASIRLDASGRGTATVGVRNIRPKDKTSGPYGFAGSEYHVHTRWRKITFKSTVEEVKVRYDELWVKCRVREDALIDVFHDGTHKATLEGGNTWTPTIKIKLKDYPAFAKGNVRPGDPAENIWQAPAQPVESSGPARVVVELRGVSHTERCMVAAGGVVIVKVRQYASTGYKDPPRLTPPTDRAVRLVESRTEPAPGTGIGARGGTYYVWRFAVARGIRGEFPIVVELKRPWESRPSIRHTLIVVVQ